MAVKNVWGVILIVLGVVSFIGGFQQISEISQYDQLMEISKRQLGTYQSLLKDDINFYNAASRNAKFGGILKIIVGVAFALWGTWLLQASQRFPGKESLEPLPRDVYDWKFKSEEKMEDHVSPGKPLVTPIYSDKSRPNIAKARCETCKKELTYPVNKVGALVSCPQCGTRFELP
jgi:hypothetical protein